MTPEQERRLIDPRDLEYAVIPDLGIIIPVGVAKDKRPKKHSQGTK